MIVQKGLVSIGLPTHNGSFRLRKALNSLLSQKYTAIEIIISDNASSDKTRKVCQEFAKKDKRLVYLIQNKNIGMMNNFYLVLQKARGEYFMWAADDDWWDKNFILKLKTALDKHLDYGVAMSSTVRIYENGEERDRITFSGKNNLTKFGHFQLFVRMIKGDPIHIFIYGLFRTKVLRNLTRRPFPKCMAADRVFMCQAALITRFYSIGDFLYVRRVYKKPIIQRYKNSSIGDEWSNPKRNSKYLMTLFKFLMTSNIIPFYRKLWFVPCWLLLIWRSRNRLASELSQVYFSENN